MHVFITNHPVKQRTYLCFRPNSIKVPPKSQELNFQEFKEFLNHDFEIYSNILEEMKQKDILKDHNFKTLEEKQEFYSNHFHGVEIFNILLPPRVFQIGISLFFSKLDKIDFSKNPHSIHNDEKQMTYIETCLKDYKHNIQDLEQPIMTIINRRLTSIPETMRRYFPMVIICHSKYKRLFESIKLEEDIEKFQKVINIKFTNPSLISQAFTLKKNNDLFHMQKLEFLGDSILDFIVSKWIFKRYPSMKGVSNLIL